MMDWWMMDLNISKYCEIRIKQTQPKKISAQLLHKQRRQKVISKKNFLRILFVS